MKRMENREEIRAQIKTKIKRNTLTLQCKRGECGAKFQIPLVNLELNTQQTLICTCGRPLHIPSLMILSYNLEIIKNGIYRV
jgi:hypothetical protein